MTYDNLKSHKRSGLHAFFAKVKGGGGGKIYPRPNPPTPSAFLGLK